MSGFQVMEKKCDQCLFSEHKIVSDARRKDILAECRRKDAHFICHKASIAGDKDVCCRGFYDTRSTNLIRIAERLNMVEFVQEEDL